MNSVRALFWAYLVLIGIGLVYFTLIGLMGR